MYAWYKFKSSAISQGSSAARAFQAEFENYCTLLYMND
jgi:hypothetical protein